MEDTARLFIVVIGFCFLIAFVSWVFVKSYAYVAKEMSPG